MDIAFIPDAGVCRSDSTRSRACTDPAALRALRIAVVGHARGAYLARSCAGARGGRRSKVGDFSLAGRDLDGGRPQAQQGQLHEEFGLFACPMLT